jgi:hypothetical protein
MGASCCCPMGGVRDANYANRSLFLRMIRIISTPQKACSVRLRRRIRVDNDILLTAFKTAQNGH